MLVYSKSRQFYEKPVSLTSSFIFLSFKYSMEVSWLCSYITITLTNFYFFFSSRRRHTRYWRDWSSDVCSSDLGSWGTASATGSSWATSSTSATSSSSPPAARSGRRARSTAGRSSPGSTSTATRSEERRGGEEWRSRWSTYHLKKKKARETQIYH